MPQCCAPHCTSSVAGSQYALCDVHSRVPPATLSARKPGQSAREKADSIASKNRGRRLLSKLSLGRYRPPDYSWRVGADAEEAVGRELAKLPPGWFVRHDVMIGGRWNVDHVVVGPPGVFLFDTKFRSGVVKTTREGIRLNGRATDMTEKVQAQAREVSARLRDAAGTRQWVQPVIVFDNDVLGSSQPDRVHVVGLTDVVRYLMNLPPMLDTGSVARLGRALLGDSTWAAASASGDDTDAVFYAAPRRRSSMVAALVAGALLAGVGALWMSGRSPAPLVTEPAPVEAIRSRYQAVGAKQFKLKKVQKTLRGVSAANSTLVGYFDGATLKKAEWRLAGETRELMFHAGRLEFVFQTAGDRETRAYLVDGKVIWATTGKDRKPVSPSETGIAIGEFEKQVIDALNTNGDVLTYEAGKFVAKTR